MQILSFLFVCSRCWRWPSWARRSRRSSCPKRASPGSRSSSSRSSTACWCIEGGPGARAIRLRALYAPVALVSLPLVWMLLMVIAFTFIFWGTGSLSVQQAFEISGSSLTTLGFKEPDTTTRIWLAFIEATIGLGLGGAPHQLSADDLRRLQQPGEGHHPAPPADRRAPKCSGAVPDAPAHRGRREPGILEQPVRLDPGHAADPHRLPDPHVLPRDAPRPLVGGDRGHAARRLPRSSCRRRGHTAPIPSRRSRRGR